MNIKYIYYCVEYVIDDVSYCTIRKIVSGSNCLSEMKRINEFYPNVFNVWFGTTKRQVIEYGKFYYRDRCFMNC